MRVITLFIVAASLLLSGCGAWQAVSDTTVNVTKAVFSKQVKVVHIDFNAHKALNLDDQQRPLTVVVRVYQLRDRKAFDAASYEMLLQQDRVVLAQDLLDMQGAVVRPDGAVSLSQPMREDTRFIAVVAFFRDVPVDADWRRVVARDSLSADQPLRYELLGNQLIGAEDSMQRRSQ